MLPRMRGARRGAASSWSAILAFAVGAVVALELLRPLRAGAVGFDTAASVLHFERLVAGRHLESFVTATPKPLLTLIDGTLMALTHDWRVLVFATLLAFAAVVAAATALAGRLAGPAAGLLGGFFVLSSARLLADVAIAYALAWAALLCLLAGLALVRSRPRPAVAGIALAAATLARLEVVAIVGTALAILLIVQVVMRRRGTAGPGRSWWGIALALLAFPIMGLHDLLLTGDPLFWMTVSEVYSRQAPESVLSPIGVVGLVARRMAAEWPLVLLGVGGLVALWRSREWAVLTGIAGSTLGIAGFLVAIAIRGTYVSDRYLGLIDLGVRLAAGIGLAALLAAVLAQLAVRKPSIEPSTRVGAAVAAGVLLAVFATWRPGFLNASVRRAAERSQSESAQVDAALPVLRCALASIAGGAPDPPAATTFAVSPPTSTLLLGPVLMRPRLAHDLQLSLGAVAGFSRAQLDPARFLPRGQVLFHERIGDRPMEAFTVLEVDRETAVGEVVLTPLVTDPASGVWILWVGRPGGPPAPTSCGGRWSD